MPEDVSKRHAAGRKAPKALEPEGQFGSLLEAAPDAVVVVDQTGTIVFVNSQTERLFRCQREEMLGRDVEVIVPVRLREQHRHHRMDFFSNPHIRPSPLKMQLFALRKDGTEFPVEISLSPVETAEGFLVTSSIRDVSERKAADESRFRLAAIVESSEDAIASVTPDGVIVSWNAGAQRIFGYTEAEALGKSVTMLVPPELPNEESRILERLRTGSSIEHFETARITKTGERINVSLSISPIKDSTGQTVAFSGITRDITERKLAEQALRASEERLRLAQQAASIGTFEWNIQTGVNTWTPELEELYGLPPGGFGGTQTAFENLVHPDDRAGVIQLNLWALRTGQPTQGEWRVVWPNGSIHWIAGRWQVFMNESGEPSRMLGVNLDVTERKLGEEALRESELRFRLATQAGRMYAYDWNVTTDVVVRSPEHVKILGLPEPLRFPQNQFVDKIHSDDRPKFLAAIDGLTPENPTGEVTYRALASDGSLVWLKSNGRGFFDSEGKLLRVVGMVANVTDHKLAEQRLREYEKTVEGLEEMIAVVDREYRYLIANRKFLDMRNMSKEQVEGHFAYEVLNKGVFEGVVKEKLDECFQGKVVRFEMKYTYPGLGERDVLISYFPIESVTGIDRVACIVQDITERKLAEEALSSTTRKLIEAQEKERARIARDLHDDIAQRIALLCIGLDRLQHTPLDSVGCTSIGELRAQTEEILADVQSLSHELHSSKLEHLGMAAAMRNLCKEFGEQQKMEIHFQSDDLPCTPPLQVSVTLFRVLQEALRNVAKHSGVNSVEVRLRGTTNEILLTIGDLGKGFDVATAMQGKGLGLTSMQERVRLINGTIAIESKPLRGTTIHACIPLDSQHRFERQAV